MRELTKENLLKALDKIDSSNYGVSERALKEVFLKYPDHNSLEGIVIKVALLDRMYSTNLGKAEKDIVSFAKKIMAIENIDKRISNGDYSVIEEIIKIIPNKKPFSFATKYCCLHNYFIYEKDDYSIVDSIVKKYLSKYIKQAKKENKLTYSISNSQLEKFQQDGQYKEICDIIGDLLKVYNIDLPNKRRVFDYFLWIQGKGINF